MKTFMPVLVAGAALMALVANTASAQQDQVFVPDMAANGNNAGGTFATQIMPNWPGNVWFSYTGTGSGVGYDTGGYFTLGAKTRLGEDIWGGRWMLEGRGHLAHNQGNVFGNFGIERVVTLEPAFTDIGASLWFDADGDANNNFGHNFQQIAVGGFLRNRLFTVRANGYVPVGSTGFTLGSATNCFVGNSILLQHGIDTALQGFDTEIRFRPAFAEMIQGTVDIGGYYYADVDRDITGVDPFGGFRFRLGMTTLRGVMLQAEVNTDHRFGVTAYGRVVIDRGIFGQYDPLGQDLAPTVRNDHVVRVHQNVVLAIDPDTLAPYRALHVDNTATAGGAGTAESPYSTLSAAEAASMADDVILVRRGDGTSVGYDQGIVLKNGQFLLGDGVQHIIPLAGGGMFELCNLQDGNKPILTNNGGDIVTLANRNTVAGLILDGADPALSGIVGTNVTGGVTIRDNMIRNMLVDGVRINGISGNITINNNMITNVADDAIELRNISSKGNTIQIANNTIGGAAGLGIGNNGILIDTFASENLWMFDNNTITNTGIATPAPGDGDGIALLNGMDMVTGTGGMFLFSSNSINSAGRHGINFTNVSDPEGVIMFSMNSITNSGVSGIHIEDSDPALVFVPATATTSGNTITGGMNGLEYVANDGGSHTLSLMNLTLSGSVNGALVRATAGSTIDVTALDNIFENNTGNGASFIANDPGSTININTFRNNIMRNNGGRGVSLFGDDNTVLTGNFQQNLFLNNARGGLIAETIGGNLDLIIGGAAPVGKPQFVRNLFDGNGGAGIGIVFRGDATGRFAIAENTITRTVNDPNSTIFNGEGIQIRFAGADALANSTAVLPVDPMLGPSFISNNIIGSLTDPTLGNASHGILVHAEDETVIAGLDVLDNVSANNGGDGVNFFIRDAAMANNVRIARNLIQSNSDGIQISALQAGMFTAVEPGGGISMNTISQNNQNGILLNVQADGQIDVDITDNTIDANLANGIATTESFNSAGDTRTVRGTWSFNDITNNQANGINLGSSVGVITSIFPMPPVTDPLLVSNNMIDSNGLWGVQVLRRSAATFTANQITRNGTLNTTLNGSGGGVNVVSNTNAIIDGIIPSGSKVLDFQSNLIFDNEGDGLRIQNVGTNVAVGTFVINANGNTIEANSGRGVNLFNQGNAQTFATFTNNKIASNDLEGFYAVNTSSTTQSADVSSTTALAADGSVFAFPRLNLMLDNNRIINNGFNSLFSATGFVLRVGTSDGGYGFMNDGGFADDNNDGVLDHGGVLASITNNMFSGNYGDDVFINSFVSTVDPATTGGAWTDQNTNPRDFTNDTFNPQGYQGDPLARLDLLWSGNMFESLAVNNIGAFYTNNEPVFKSRTQGQDNGTDGPVLGGDDNGPFNSGTRQRNAQRLGARNVALGGTQLPPNFNFGGSQNFLFPGMGQSTFRLLPGFDGTVNFIQDDFYIDIFDAMGPTNGAPPDFMPYGWNFNGGNPRPQ